MPSGSLAGKSVDECVGHFQGSVEDDFFAPGGGGVVIVKANIEFDIPAFVSGSAQATLVQIGRDRRLRQPGQTELFTDQGFQRV